MIPEDRESFAALLTERNDLRMEVIALKKRQQELLSAMGRVANETPFVDEARDALAQRGKLVAEIGTLRQRCEQLLAAKDEACELALLGELSFGDEQLKRVEELRKVGHE